MKATTLLVAGALVVGAPACGAREKRVAPAPATTTQATPKPKPRFVHPHDGPVPILEYHVIGDPPAGAPFPELYVGRSAFAAQLRWLRAHGYHAVSLRRAYDYWRRGLALPPRPVVLSFDDGYRGQFVN